ncbi:MAG: hypothetical protein R3195_02120 [Gemmatimonadota bacterium]|nr:hypothetical protein [Gemmatimonadota bacterium]
MSFRSTAGVGLAVLFVAAATIAAAAPPVADSPREKCTPRETGDDPDLPEIVIILDGEILADSTGAPVRPDLNDLEAYGIQTSDIDHVEIICWNVVEKRFGLRVRSGAVEVFMKEGWRPPGPDSDGSGSSEGGGSR